jgi:hypothetical protein
MFIESISGGVGGGGGGNFYSLLLKFVWHHIHETEASIFLSMSAVA